MVAVDLGSKMVKQIELDALETLFDAQESLVTSAASMIRSIF